MELSNLETYFVRLVICAIIAMIFVKDEKKNDCCQEYCYSMDNELSQNAYFSSKTPYFVMKGPQTDDQFSVPNCSPVKIWLYVRHGARFPKADKEMKRLSELENLRDDIITNYEKRDSRSALCESDLNLLKKWQWNRDITEEQDEFLSEQGWEEVKFLATRYKNLFPNIFGNIYDSSKFLFRHTDAQRTQASFRAFIEGLFGENAHESITVAPLKENLKLLKPYALCSSDEGEISGSGSELQKYLESPIMTQLLSAVSERLGFNYTLTEEQVLDIHQMCLYDYSWNLNMLSPWCAAFTPEQFHDLEYPEDLRKYYECGYGQKSNERLLCGLVNDMLDHLENNEHPKAVVYLTHSSSLLLMLTALKAFKDDDTLRADNYHSMSNRKWRLSEIAPFASNIAVIKYDCPNDVEHEKVKFFLNEKPIEFEGCQNGLCGLKGVKERYKEYKQANCDEYFCSNYSKV